MHMMLSAPGIHGWVEMSTQGVQTMQTMHHIDPDFAVSITERSSNNGEHTLPAPCRVGGSVPDVPVEHLPRPG